MVNVEILIPTTDNGGTPFAPSHHAVFEAEIVARFGAFSLLPALVIGQWAHAGIVYVDQSRTYRIGVQGLLAEAGAILVVVAFAKAHYGQLALCVAYLGLSEVL